MSSSHVIVRTVVALTLVGGVGLSAAVRVSAAAEVSTSAAQQAAQAGALARTGSGLETFQTDLFTGRATTAIPIQVPPGRRIQPSLALTYASGGEHGWLGLGWSLALGGIERSTKKGVPTYNDAKDTFTASVNGVTSDLIRIVPGEYRMEIEPGTFLRFQYDGQRWLVTDKQGTRYEFGSDPACRQTTPQGTSAWLLCRIQDRLGNFLTVSYAQDQGELYLKEILYTGFEPTNEPPLHKVEFLLESRPDPIVSYRTGAKVVTAQRLKEVRTAAQGILARRYVLTYTQDPDKAQHSLLASVTEYGRDGTTALPAMRFTYTTTTPQFADPVPWGPLQVIDEAQRGFPRWTEPSTGRTHADLLDITGDGLPDRVQTNGDNGVWRLQRGTPAGLGPHEDWGYRQVAHFFDHPSGTILRRAHLAGDANQFQTTDIELVDLTGDGRPDRLSCKDWNTAWRIQRNTGAGFAAPEDWGPVDSFGYAVGGHIRVARGVNRRGVTVGYVELVDLTGDGLPDRVFGQDEQAFQPWRVQVNTGAGFAPAVDWGPIRQHPQTSSNDYAGVRYLNDNGHQLVDLADLNGDGLPDRILVADHIPDPMGRMGRWVVQWNTGTGFTEPVPWGPVDEFTGGPALRGVRYHDGQRLVVVDLADLNADGLPDRFYAPAGSVAWEVQWNTGAGFTPRQSWTGIANEGDGQKSHARAVTPGGAVFCDLVDMTGDGVPDRLLATAGNTNWRVQPNRTAPQGFLTTVDNGRGGTLTVTYEPSTGGDHTHGDGVADLPFPVWVVREVTTSDGRGWSGATRYAYRDGMFDSSMKEFRGFGRVTVTDPEGAAATTWFHQDAHRRGKPLRVEVRDGAGRLYTKTESLWQCCDVGTVPPGQACPLGVHFNALMQQDAFTYDVDGTFRQTRARFQYDGFGNVTRQLDDGEVADPADDRQAITEYAVNEAAWLVGLPKRATVADPQGNPLTRQMFYYDSATAIETLPTKGLLTKQETWLNTGPSNPTTTLTYDPYGNVLTTTDPLGRTITTVYDSSKTFPIKVTNVLGHVLQTIYDPGTGNVLTTTDPNGQVTTHQYDPLGRLTAVIGPLDLPSQPGALYNYDLTTVPTKRVRQVRTTSGGSELYTSYEFFDGLGRLIQVKTPAENPAQQVVSETKVFDARGLVKEAYKLSLTAASSTYSTPDLAQPKVAYTYDSLGRVTKVTNPDGTFTTTAYTPRIVTLTDEAGKVTVRYLDASGRMIKVEEKNGSETYTTTYTYDLLSRLTKTTDAKGNVTTMTYDSLGRKTKMTDPDMGTWRYTYDAVGNLRTQADAKGQLLTFIYDALNRVTQKGVHGSGPVPSTYVTYRYDDTTQPNRLGRLAKVTDASGSTEFFYDRLGREIKTTKAVGPTAYTFERTYDALNRLMTLKYPDGEVVTYTYTPQGIEKVEGTVPGGGLSSYVTNLDYTPTGQLAKQVMNGGLATTAYTYDEKTLRLATLKTTNGANIALQDLSYRFDAVGNVTQLTDARRSAVQTFRYDDRHRLTRAESPATYGTRDYAYDPLGNLTLKDGITQTYAHPTKPHAVTSRSDGLTMIYDANGNMVTKGAQTLTYDAENRLVEAQGALAPPTSLAVSLRPGWNLVTCPYTPTDLALSVVLGAAWGRDIDQVTRWNPATSAYEFAEPSGRFSAFTRLEVGRGYWVHVTNPAGVTLTFTGTLSPPAQTLPTGWVLVGTAVFSEQAVAEALGGLVAGADYSRVVCWTGTAFSDAVTVKPGEALFVRIARAVTWTPPVHHDTHTRFTYDGDGGRVQKVTDAGTTTYVGKLLEIQPDGTVVKYLWVGSTRLAAKTSTGALRFYHPNHLGSTDLVTDAQGTQIAHYEYTPWGELHSTEGITVPHQYTGKERDPETGFYFYEARYYDPQLGRFITPDTIVPNWSNPQDFNRYTYANNNPIIYTDPTGHFSWKSVGKFFRQIVAPVVSVVAAIFAGPLAGIAAYNQFATFGANLERGRGFLESVGRGWLAGAATMFGGSIGGGAASARLSGQDPGRGALLGLVQGASAAIGGSLGVPTDPFAAIAQSAAIGAVTGAAGAAIVGGNPLVGAAYGAGFSAAVTAGFIAAGNIQAALDAARSQRTPRLSRIPEGSVGVYRDPSRPGLYSDNPVIYRKTQLRFEGVGFIGGRSALRDFSAGAILEGSTRIVVYGDPVTNTPTSWRAAIFAPTEQHLDYSKYGWQILDENAARRLAEME